MFIQRITLFSYEVAFALFITIFFILNLFLRKKNSKKIESILREDKIRKDQIKEIKNKKEKLEAIRKSLTIEKEKSKSFEKKLELEEKRILNLSEQLFRKEEVFLEQLSLLNQRERKIREDFENIEKIRAKVIDRLGKSISISKEEAERNLEALLKKNIDNNLNEYKENSLAKAKEKIKEKVINILCSAMEKYSSELVFSKTVSSIEIENKQIVSKIIGKEGRNISYFRRVTGTNLIIDKEGDSLSIRISSFNSFRREKAVQTLNSLIKSERISPDQIFSTYQKISSEIEEIIKNNASDILMELGITGVHEELTKNLGKLKYRTSYGQNVLEHSIEVAKIMGWIAAELGLDVTLAKRVGIFHDIGKSSEDDEGYSHVLSGISMAKKYNEGEEVINAIASHHRDFPANNVYSLMLLAADRLSAARPGSRGYQLEAYVERMNSLEKIANEFPGINKSYAFQAGREIWIIADSTKLSDYQTLEVSKKIKEKIKKEIVIPGEVTIYVVREKIFVQKINDKKKE